MVPPDFVTGLQASLTFSVGYLLTKPILRYTPQEMTVVEIVSQAPAGNLAATAMSPSTATGQARPSLDRAHWAVDDGPGHAAEDRPCSPKVQASGDVRFLCARDGSHRFGALAAFEPSGISWSLGAALDGLVLMESQGLPAREILMPNIDRMAGFWIVHGPITTVLWPCAKENNAVTVGSNCKVQDMLDVPASIYLYLTFNPGSPSAPGLRSVQPSTLGPLTMARSSTMLPRSRLWFTRTRHLRGRTTISYLRFLSARLGSRFKRVGACLDRRPNMPSTYHRLIAEDAPDTTRKRSSAHAIECTRSTI